MKRFFDDIGMNRNVILEVFDFRRLLVIIVFKFFLLM